MNVNLFLLNSEEIGLYVIQRQILVLIHTECVMEQLSGLCDSTLTVFISEPYNQIRNIWTQSQAPIQCLYKVSLDDINNSSIDA